MSRREFTNDVYAQVMKRAEVATGWQCEICGLIVRSGHVDHKKADGLEVDKSAKLTAEQGQFVCVPCHKIKTAKDVAMIAKAKRVEARHLGAHRSKAKIATRPKAPRDTTKTDQIREMRERRFEELNDGQ